MYNKYMNYTKLIQSFLENRGGASSLPPPLAWIMRHAKLVIGLVIGFCILSALLVIAVLVAAIVFFSRATPQLPSSDTLIQSGREYFDQQFGLENRKLDQLQKELQDVKDTLRSTPAPSPTQ